MSNKKISGMTAVTATSGMALPAYDSNNPTSDISVAAGDIAALYQLTSSGIATALGYTPANSSAVGVPTVEAITANSSTNTNSNGGVSVTLVTTDGSGLPNLVTILNPPNLESYVGFTHAVVFDTQTNPADTLQITVNGGTTLNNLIGDYTGLITYNVLKGASFATYLTLSQPTSFYLFVWNGNNWELSNSTANDLNNNAPGGLTPSADYALSLTLHGGNTIASGTTAGGFVKITGGAANNGALSGDVTITAGGAAGMTAGNITLNPVGNSGTGLHGRLRIQNLPTTDPAQTNAVWSSGNNLVLSGYAPPAITAMTKIATVTIPGIGAPSVTFSSLGTYTDLQIRIEGQTSETGIASKLQMNFNGDVASNYTYQYLAVQAGTVSSASATNPAAAWCGCIGGTTSAGSCIIDIPGYRQTTYNKTVSAKGVSDGNIFETSAIWKSTAAITSIVLSIVTGGQSFTSGTVVTLYGIG